MAVTIVLTNQKGGVGKTTTTAALAAGLAAKDKRVLAVDLDPQGNLGFSLGLDIETESASTIYEVLKNRLPLSHALRSAGVCDVVPSNILLSQAEIELQTANRVTLLKESLEEVARDYDFVVIDTPPSLNILTMNAYAASDYLVIPMASEILSLEGLIQLQETVAGVKSSVNPQLEVLGILLTKYNRRTRLAKDVLEMAETVAAQTQTALFDTKIRAGVAAAEAPAHGENIFEYAPRSNPAKDYECFVNEVLERIGRQEKHL